LTLGVDERTGVYQKQNNVMGLRSLRRLP